MFSFTYYGYAAILLHFEKRILIDPGVIKGKALVKIEKVTPHYVLVSHTPPEHLGNASEFAIDKGSVIIGNSQVIDQGRIQGVQSYALESINDAQTIEVGANVSITAYELRRSGFFAPRNTAFLITSDQGSVIHLGHAKECEPLRELKPDLLCIPVIGKKQGTFNPQEAVKATHTILPRYALPISGNSDQINEYNSLLKEANLGISVLQPKIGESINLV